MLVTQLFISSQHLSECQTIFINLREKASGFVPFNSFCQVTEDISALCTDMTLTFKKGKLLTDLLTNGCIFRRILYSHAPVAQRIE